MRANYRRWAATVLPLLLVSGCADDDGSLAFWPQNGLPPGSSAVLTPSSQNSSPADQPPSSPPALRPTPAQAPLTFDLKSNTGSQVVARWFPPARVSQTAAGASPGLARGARFFSINMASNASYVTYFSDAMNLAENEVPEVLLNRFCYELPLLGRPTQPGSAHRWLYMDEHGLAQTPYPHGGESVDISADGQAIAFTAPVPGFGDPTLNQIYLSDQSGSKLHVTVGTDGKPADGSCAHPNFAHGGDLVFFDSSASNLPGATGDRAVYVFDRRSSQLRRVVAGELADNGNSVSEDGQIVLLNRLINNNGDTAALYNVASGTQTNLGRFRFHPSLSADGNVVAFSSREQLTLAATNDFLNIYALNRSNGQIRLVSTSAAGTTPNMDCDNPLLSGDGRYVVFSTEASNLDPSDDNAMPDVFWKDTLTGELRRLTRTPPQSEGWDSDVLQIGISLRSRWRCLLGAR